MPFAIAALQASQVVVAAAATDDSKHSIAAQIPTAIAANGRVAGEAQRTKQSAIGRTVVIDVVTDAAQCSVAAGAGAGAGNDKLPRADATVALRGVDGEACAVAYHNRSGATRAERGREAGKWRIHFYRSGTDGGTAGEVVRRGHFESAAAELDQARRTADAARATDGEIVGARIVRDVTRRDRFVERNGCGNSGCVVKSHRVVRIECRGEARIEVEPVGRGAVVPGARVIDVPCERGTGGGRCQREQRQAGR